MTRTSTELPRLEPESSASTNSAMAAEEKILRYSQDFRRWKKMGRFSILEDRNGENYNV